jgi:pyridoxamine 5'-phosphate oxidase
MKTIQGKWATLQGILTEAWTMLQRGATHFNDPFHRPVLGTSTPDGSRLRTVILRQFIPDKRLLVCHTDARAQKVTEIANSSQVSWLFYHPRKRVQLRMLGHATLHTDDRFADEQWAATSAASRLNYCAGEPPGTPIGRPSSGLPDFLLNKVPTLLESDRGRRNFAVIACRIDAMDWLILRALGNRRARFDWADHELNATWVIP